MSSTDNQTEAALLFHQLSADVDQLFDLAVQIRSPDTRRVPAVIKVDLFKHISPEFKDEFAQLNEEREYHGLAQVFEQCRKEVQGEGQNDHEHPVPDQDQPTEHPKLSVEDQIILRRLLRANHIRRCHFQYWKRYKSKSMQTTSRVIKLKPLLYPAGPLSQKTLAHPEGQGIIHSLAFSQQPSSRLQSEMPLAPDFALKGPSSSKSSRVRTVSVKGADGLVVHWPLPPAQVLRRITEFECPYCFFLCSFRTMREDAWRYECTINWERND